MKLAGVVLTGVLAAAPMGMMAATAPAACGDVTLTYGVALDKKQHDAGAPETGKALVVFVQDLGLRQGVKVPFSSPVTRIGINGQWVGANKNASWFAVSVDPGPLHVCASGQGFQMDDVVELLSLNAVAGQTYYFRVRNLSATEARLEFAATNEDQGRWMVENLPKATGTAKK